MEELFKKLTDEKLVRVPLWMREEFRDFCSERGLTVFGGAFAMSCGVVVAQYMYV